MDRIPGVRRLSQSFCIPMVHRMSDVDVDTDFDFAKASPVTPDDGRWLKSPTNYGLHAPDLPEPPARLDTLASTVLTSTSVEAYDELGVGGPDVAASAQSSVQVPVAGGSDHQWSSSIDGEDDDDVAMEFKAVAPSVPTTVLMAAARLKRIVSARRSRQKETQVPAAAVASSAPSSTIPERITMQASSAEVVSVHPQPRAVSLRRSSSLPEHGSIERASGLLHASSSGEPAPQVFGQQASSDSASSASIRQFAVEGADVSSWTGRRAGGSSASAASAPPLLASRGILGSIYVKSASISEKIVSVLSKKQADTAGQSMVEDGEEMEGRSTARSLPNGDQRSGPVVPSPPMLPPFAAVAGDRRRTNEEQRARRMQTLNQAETRHLVALHQSPSMGSQHSLRTSSRRPSAHTATTPAHSTPSTAEWDGKAPRSPPDTFALANHFSALESLGFVRTASSGTTGPGFSLVATSPRINAMKEKLSVSGASFFQQLPQDIEHVPELPTNDSVHSQEAAAQMEVRANEVHVAIPPEDKGRIESIHFDLLDGHVTERTGRDSYRDSSYPASASSRTASTAASHAVIKVAEGVGPGAVRLLATTAGASGTTGRGHGARAVTTALITGESGISGRLQVGEDGALHVFSQAVEALSSARPKVVSQWRETKSGSKSVERHTEVEEESCTESILALHQSTWKQAQERLTIYTPVADRKSSRGLAELTLTSCGLSADQVLLLPHLPNLHTLDVSDNSLHGLGLRLQDDELMRSSMMQSSESRSSVQTEDSLGKVSANVVTWLSFAPNLSVLSIRGCALQELPSFLTVQGSPVPLDTLDVSCNKLRSVEGIETIARTLIRLDVAMNDLVHASAVRSMGSLQALHHLLLHPNPVTLANAPSSVRALLNSLLPCLRSVDGVATAHGARVHVQGARTGRLKIQGQENSYEAARSSPRLCRGYGGAPLSSVVAPESSLRRPVNESVSRCATLEIVAKVLGGKIIRQRSLTSRQSIPGGLEPKKVQVHTSPAGGARKGLKLSAHASTSSSVAVPFLSFWVGDSDFGSASDAPNRPYDESVSGLQFPRKTLTPLPVSARRSQSRVKRPPPHLPLHMEVERAWKGSLRDKAAGEGIPGDSNGTQKPTRAHNLKQNPSSMPGPRMYAEQKAIFFGGLASAATAARSGSVDGCSLTLDTPGFTGKGSADGSGSGIVAAGIVPPASPESVEDSLLGMEFAEAVSSASLEESYTTNEIEHVVEGAERADNFADWLFSMQAKSMVILAALKRLMSLKPWSASSGQNTVRQECMGAVHAVLGSLYNAGMLDERDVSSVDNAVNRSSPPSVHSTCLLEAAAADLDLQGGSIFAGLSPQLSDVERSAAVGVASEWVTARCALLLYSIVLLRGELGREITSFSHNSSPPQLVAGLRSAIIRSVIGPMCRAFIASLDLRDEALLE